MLDFQQFFNSELGIATYTLLGMAGLRFLIGSYAALRDETFVLSSVAAFIRSQLLGRVFPILTTWYFAASTGNAALIAAAGAVSAAYVAETVGAITESLSQTQAKATLAKEEDAMEKGNPVPTD